ncbi:MAG: exopolysaccharide biosynthesis polyprenyl glycosylphosphotransferase [Candidatus Sulfotelmatobacter sp.]
MYRMKNEWCEISSVALRSNQSPHESWCPARLIPGAAFGAISRGQPSKHRDSITTPFGAEIVRWARHSGRSSTGARQPRNLLIIGAGDLGQRIKRHVAEHPEQGRSFSGFLDDEKTVGGGVLGRISDLAEVARTRFVDEVIVAATHDKEGMFRIFCEGRKLHLDVKMAADLCGSQAIAVENLGNIPILAMHEEKLPTRELFLKRVFDVVISAGTLLLLAPALLLIAVFVKLDSRGPALYIAPRAGRKGQPFPCYKFRTMVPEADSLKAALRFQNQRSGPFFKIKRDPRISRIGRFLRRYSLDELPQLWNVLKGDMSLVGPRPHPLDDVSGYSIEHLPRLDVKPGITGLWQVTARTNPSFQTGVNLDVRYIDSWTLGMDFRILLKTAGAVLRGSGE